MRACRRIYGHNNGNYRIIINVTHKIWYPPLNFFNCESGYVDDTLILRYYH